MVTKSVVTRLTERFNPSKGLYGFKPTLRIRLLIVIVSASLIIVLVSTLLSLRYQRKQLIESAQSSASALNSAIEANLQHAMLTGDRGMIEEIVRAIVAQGSVESLRILDDQGLVHASSVESEEGFRFTQAEEICQACHVNSPSQRSKNVVLIAENGREVLLNVNLIENKAQCHTCHSPENQVLGLMMIETSLSGVNEQLRTGFWRTILIAVTAFLLLIVLIVPTLNRYIVRPINELSKGVAEISAGNLDYQVPVVSQDDLGELANSFDNMRQQLKITRTEMVQREQELAILNEVGLAATQLLDLQEILEITLDTMVGKLGMDNALIYLWDEAVGRYTMQASRGISQAQIDEIERRRQSGYDITQEVVETGKEEFVVNMADDPRFTGVWQNLQDRSYVKLPLMSRGTVVGVLGVVTPVGQSLSSHDVDFLKLVGREIGIAIDNATLLADTKQRENQAITLYRLGMKISASLTISDVLDAVARAARELMNADIGLVGLMDDEAQGVIVKAVAGAQSNLTINTRMTVSKQSPWSVLSSGQLYLTAGDDPDLHCLHDEDLISREQIKSVLAVPLLRGGQFLGLVEVMTRKPRFFKQRDGRLLSRLANQVVVAVENAQLYRQLHHLVTLEERDRLARELHDHLAQGLAYLKVKASITEGLLSNAQIEQAQVSLLELKKASQVLYTDVREEIFNLRTAVKEQDGFFSVLRDYLIDYETHYDLEIHMIIEDDCPSEFSSEVASQLLRVIQEALTNVRRHSDAAKVLINCRQGGEQVCISIEDDGQGFYPDEVTKNGGQRYGLQIMRERAESVGGSLEIDSLPGKGTRVVVSVPPMYEEL